ncbi:heat shock protein GrpE [Caulifigura coniformis]|uniref:Protein GrpE n=1 Tax=Caulifigura coniformis TaxID=2527983 RepID=A0A517SAZ6_9PLAN|nr:nucleotide exchange factor GrpE [Caulifigura coniformis]QDT53292.1 heat shock protein GrpE [Caulifigura coniformis]
MAKPQKAEAREEIETEAADIQPEQSQIESLSKERDQNFEKYLRAQAELETARRRWRQEMDEYRKYQAMPLVRDLLPSLDNLRRAVDAAQTGATVESLRTGVEMVLRQIDDVLAKHDARPIPALGQPFDPNLHEAITQIPTADQPPMSVVLEAERGYQMHDRIVRPSKVGVAVPPAS